MQNDQDWQVPQPAGEGPGRLLSRRPVKVALGAALVVALGLGGAGIAYAATGSSSSGSSSSGSSSSGSSSSSPPASTPSGGPGLGHRFHAGIGPFGGLGAVLHGQAVVASPGGGYQTVVFQQGTASSVSSSSITVTSKDGYSHQYAVNAQTVVDAQRDGISTVSNGDQVAVVAVSSGGTDTARRITDATKIRAAFPNAGARMPTTSGLGSGTAAA